MIRKGLSKSYIAVLIVVAAACGGGPALKLEEEQTTRVVAMGDFGVTSEAQGRIADTLCRTVTNRPIRHIVSTGDSIYGTGHPSEFTDNFKEPFACLFENGVQFHAALGNHDVLTRNGLPEINDPAFGMLGRYYTWSVGPLTFIMVDSNNLPSGGKQMEWLISTLERVRDRPWTVVAFHHPVYSAGTVHGSTEGYDTMLGKPFSDLGVDLVLNGHDHNYQHAFSEGVTYFVTGGGGANTYGCEDPLPPPTDVCIETYHFLELRATRESLTVAGIDDTGHTFDLTTVPPNDSDL